MGIETVGGVKGQIRAIVHVPQEKQRREGSPVFVAARKVKKTSRILSFSGRCAEQYERHARVYIPEIPPIVLDIKR